MERLLTRRLCAALLAWLLAGSGAGAAYNTQPGLFAPLASGAPAAALAGYTAWLNQGSATETDSALGMAFSAPSQGGPHAVNALVKAAPATPYTVTLLLIPSGGAPFSDANILIGWYDGANKIDALALNAYYGPLAWSHNTYATPTNPANAPTPSQQCPAWVGLSSNSTCGAYVMAPLAVPPASQLWVRLANSGTALTVSVSSDGENYTQLYSFATANGYLIAGYTDLLIGADADLGQAAFTIASYTD